MLIDTLTLAWRGFTPYFQATHKMTEEILIHFVNRNWVDNRWQQYSTHLHTDNTHNNTVKQNTQNRTYLTIKTHKHKDKNT